MSDFLRNLRSSHKKNQSNPKRNLDGHYYPKDDRRQNFDRRFNTSESIAHVLESIEQALPRFSDNADDITEELKKIRRNSDKITQAKLQQISSTTEFFDHLNKMFNNDLFKGPQMAAQDGGYTVGRHYTKKDILQIIKTMRDKGSTFSLIAQYLSDKGIPTFSGRGEWHAQTIHRLCK